MFYFGREMMRTSIRGAATWRSRTVKRFPNEPRNMDAYEALERIAATIDDVPDALFTRLQNSMGQIAECGEGNPEELWGDMLRSIGFYSNPKDATVLIKQFLARYERAMA